MTPSPPSWSDNVKSKIRLSWKNPSKFHPDPTSNDGPLGFFEDIAQTGTTTTRTRWVAIWDQRCYIQCLWLQVMHALRFQSWYISVKWFTLLGRISFKSSSFSAIVWQVRDDRCSTPHLWFKFFLTLVRYQISYITLHHRTCFML